MTIEEAIKHIDEVVSNGAMCEECSKEHLQLKQWLLENIELKKENEELINENTELKTKKIPQLERKIASIRGCHSVAVKKLNARIEQVERLKKENAELKEQVEQMKCCGNCQSVFDADGFCYLYKDGKCVGQSEWVKNEYNLVKKEKNK